MILSSWKLINLLRRRLGRMKILRTSSIPEWFWSLPRTSTARCLQLPPHRTPPRGRTSASSTTPSCFLYEVGIQNKNYIEAVEDLFSFSEKHMDKQPKEKCRIAEAQYQIRIVLGYH